ncbi:MAG: tyrosine--tRNA ligase, partial [Nitrospinota bacterium]
KKPLRIKAGFDPTAPDLHLGHTVLMQKLKHFQDIGHQVIFLIGDFTATIGDPSGRSALRPPLSRDQVLKNCETYQKQVFKILDKNKTAIRFNSEWMGKMTASELVELASKQTVARMLERDDFTKRYTNKTAIGIHEFLYPLIQGYDSVALKADVELGGTDQRFNLLVGRELQKIYNQQPQVVITLPLLVGTDGIQKMSKSYNNFIGITESAKDIFGKIMSVSDSLMFDYYELLSDLPLEEVTTLRSLHTEGKLNPMEHKKRLGVEMTNRFWGSGAGDKARAEFENVFSKHKTPDDIPKVNVKWEGKMWLPKILKDSKTVPSTSEARRLIKQGAVTVNGVKITDDNETLPGDKKYIIKAGKRRFVEITPVQKDR